MAAIRITGGRARGRVIRGKVLSGVRPTSSRVREALFSMVGQDLDGQTVLDAFGGSGLLGIEAWSRGAAVTVVEKRARVAAQIRGTAAGLRASLSVRVGDVTKCLGPDERFDGVLADPPYAMDPLTVLPVLARACRGWLVYEAASETPVPDEVEGLVRDRQRSFGSTTLHIFWRGEDEPDG